MYQAIINTPGYLPEAYEPAIFDTVREAWQYLRDERIQAEDEEAPRLDDAGPGSYSSTVDDLSRCAEIGDAGAIGAVYGNTPGPRRYNDLGLVYTVVPVPEPFPTDPPQNADGTVHYAYFSGGVSFVWDGVRDFISVCPGGYGEPERDRIVVDPKAILNLNASRLRGYVAGTCSVWLSEHTHQHQEG